MRLRVPLLPRILLPVPLRHHQSRHHGDQHSDGDDEHSCCFSDAELAVDPGQGSPCQLQRAPARHIAVVVDVEVANVQDLTEDTMQLTVTVPRVSCWSNRKGKSRDLRKRCIMV